MITALQPPLSLLRSADKTALRRKSNCRLTIIKPAQRRSRELRPVELRSMYRNYYSVQSFLFKDCWKQLSCHQLISPHLESTSLSTFSNISDVLSNRFPTCSCRRRKQGLSDSGSSNCQIVFKLSPGVVDVESEVCLAPGLPPEWCGVLVPVRFLLTTL